LQAINDLCEDQGWGVEVTDGHIGSVTVNIPWNALTAADSYIEVTGLNITFRPKARQTDGTSMLESMWSSMSSSMQLAQECLEKEGELPNLMAAQANTMEGLERFAHTIENVLARIKARLKDTELRLQYVSPESETGVVLIIKIESIVYQNEDGSNTTDQSAEEGDEASGQGGGGEKILLSTYTTHHIKFEGITFYTEEFRIHDPKNKVSKCPKNAVANLIF
jgi:autophagy-related protein 2